MGQASSKLRSVANGGLMFYCPACEHPHVVQVGDGEWPRWSYNGDPESPTFSPSVLVMYPGADADRRGDDGERAPSARCHSFVTEGRIQFLGDCSHEMAGRTVDLPRLPDWLQSGLTPDTA